MKTAHSLKLLFFIVFSAIALNSFAQAPVACILDEYGNTITSADTTICRRTLVKLKAVDCLAPTSSATWYSWVNLTITGVPPHNGQELQTQLNGTWQVTVNNSSGSSTKTFTINYLPEPVFYINSSPTINNNAAFIPKCSNADTVLYATTGANIINYNWYRGSLSSASIGTSTSLPLTSSNTLTTQTSYYLTAVYTVTGCTLQDNITVPYWEAPKPNLGSDTAICSGPTIKLSPKGLTSPKVGTTPAVYNRFYSFSWNGAPPQADSIYTLTSANYTVNTVNKYTVLVQGPSPRSCRNIDTIYIKVNPIPVLNPGASPTPICYGDTLLLNDVTVSNAAGPYTFAWTPKASLNDSTLQHPKASPTSNTTYSIKVKVNASGCTDTKTKTITVNPPLYVAHNFTDSTLCPGGSAQLIANASGGSGGYSYAWTPTTDLTGANTPNPTITPSGPTVYTVTVKNGSCQKKSTVNINLQPNVNPMVVASVGFADSTICPGSTVQLQGIGTSGKGPYTYSWTGPATITNPSTATPDVSPASATAYQVQVKDSRNCVSNATVNINVQPNVSPMVVAAVGFADSTICPGSTVQLQGIGTSGKGPYTYSWSPATALVNASSATPDVSPTTATTYQVQVKDSRNCVDDATVNIHMLSVDLGDPVTYALVGQTITLNASNPGTSGFSFRWEDLATNTTVGTSPTLSVTNSGKYTVYVYNGSCQVSDTKEVVFVAEIVQKVFVPNVLNTGMSESDNSNLRVYGMNVSEEDFNFRVYNNWGEMIYEVNSFNDANTIGWNGNLKNTGVALPAGVYTYTVRGKFLDGTTFDKSGTASLMR